MHARLEKFTRAMTWLNERLTPSAMQRLNRYLLLHRPVLWRSRLIWMAWWSVLLSLVFGGIGYWIARSTASVWATEDLLRLLGFVRYTGVVLAIVWAVAHLRIPLGELSFQRHAGAAAANLLVILLTFLPSHALGVAAGYAGAHLLSVSEVVDLRRYVDKLERCETDANDERRIATTLHRLGLRRRAPVDLTHCEPFLVWQSFEVESGNSGFEDAPRAAVIRDRVDSIADSQSFWHASTGNLYNNCIKPWRLELLAALCGALLLAILGYPPSARLRRLGVSLHLSARWAMPVPRVAWLERLDQRLLTRSPLIWAARLHYLLPLVASFMVAAVALNLVERALSPLANWEITQWASALAVGLWPFAWQVARRTDIGQALPGRWQAVTAISLTSVLCVPLATIPLSALVKDAEAPLILSVWAVLYGTWTTGYVLVRAYKTRFQTFLLEAAAFLLAIILGAMAMSDVTAACWQSIAFGAVGLALWLTEMASRSAAQARRRALAAALCLLMFPALLISLLRAVIIPASKHLPKIFATAAARDSDWRVIAAALVTGALLLGFVYLLALRPFIRALALAERAPRSN